MRKRSGCRNAMFVPYSSGAFNMKNKAELTKLLEAMSYTRNYKEGSNYADNVQNIYRKQLQSVDIDADFTELGFKERATIFGRTYKDGGLATSTDDQAVQGALLFEETYDDGSFERVIFYNVTLYEKDGSDSTDSDSYNFQTQGFTGKALPFENNSTGGKKLIEYRMDSADSSLDKAKFDAFYTTIQYPASDSTIAKELSYAATGTITNISESGITYSVAKKKFIIPEAFASNFTFKDGTTNKTATYAGGTWTIA